MPRGDSSGARRRPSKPVGSTAKGSRKASRGLRVCVTDQAGRRLASGGLGPWLERTAPAAARGVVVVAVVGDAQVRKLNAAYRGVDHATDVLSFPAADDARRGATRSPAVRAARGGPALLGDIVIARGVARRQARAAGHGERTEWRLLALHGLLHLLGYDHERDRGEMRRVERRLRRKGGLTEGLIDRACSPS